MMQVFYFYLNDMRRMKVTQLDGVLMLSEQHLRVHTVAIEGHVLSQWVDMARWAGIADEVESKPQHDARTSHQNRLYSVPQRKTEDLLKTAVRALGCIYRFTTDNYARDALREIEAAGWPVDWHGDNVKKIDRTGQPTRPWHDMTEAQARELFDQWWDKFPAFRDFVRQKAEETKAHCHRCGDVGCEQCS